MAKITVYSETRGVVVRLKEGVTLEQYQERYPDAVQCGKPPSMATMERWLSNCVAKALDGCRVEPDGICEHGQPSWLRALGYI